MMHAFGDVADSLLESAKFFELLVKKYLISLLSDIRDVLPKEYLMEKKPKVQHFVLNRFSFCNNYVQITKDILLVALLPDVKKLLRVIQVCALDSWSFFINTL